MANTDVGIAAGGLGKTIAAAIVQFNKASVTPRTVSMAPAVPGSNTVQFPIYTKLLRKTIFRSKYLLVISVFYKI